MPTDEANRPQKCRLTKPPKWRSDSLREFRYESYAPPILPALEPSDDFNDEPVKLSA
ncbi:hypothetical protein KCP75_00125 [Salmonella enterica subsp. enterica]|nr:hypothetical protein KCP75_00125 [Salmonella enterica subsp. enterica]